MDIKQNYREETELDVYIQYEEECCTYTDGYVEWLEKQLRIGIVSQQRELLLAFMEYYNNKTEMYKLGINDFEIDDFLANNCG